MTTIATDGKSMAGDTLVTGAGERVGYHPKVKRAKDGRIYGCAGSASEALKFARWMDGDPADKPDLTDDFEALIVNVDGTVDWIGKELEPLRYLSPMTIGSGGSLALGAMLAGKSPEEAVGIACQRDISSGGDVTTIFRDSPLQAVA